MRRVFAAVFIWLLAACATSPPVQEMSDARQALRAAIEDGAQARDPAAVARAEGLLEQAGAQLDEGRYHKARQTAAEARETARNLLPGNGSEPAPP